MLRSLPSLHTLPLGLFRLSALPPTVAFTPLYSAPTQCSPFTVTWGAPNITTGPPFVLLVLPFDATPAIVKIPDSSYDAATKTGKYTLDKLPLKSGTLFVVSMDDGYGRATGGVSLVQTVADSSDASCLAADASSMNSFFTLNPAVPSQCSSQTVSWNSTRYRQPPDIRGFIPGGQAFTLDRPTSNSTTQQVWDVHIREGTKMVLLAQPVASDQNTSADANARTSPLITITGKSSLGDACLNPNSPSSTIELASTTSFTLPPISFTLPPTAASLSESESGSGNIKIAAIAGGVVGGLGFMAIVCASIVLYRSFKRKVETFPSNRGPGSSSFGASSHQRSRPFMSGKHGSFSTPGNKSTAGITIASTQVSSNPRTTSKGRSTRRQMTATDESGTQVGSDDESRENLSARMASHGAVAFAVPSPSHKPPLNLQARAEYPPPPRQPFRHILLPHEPSSTMSSNDDTLSDQLEDPSIAYGVPLADEKQTELADVLTQSRPVPPRDDQHDQHDRTPEHGPAPAPHPWSAHPYANPLAAVHPPPPPPPPPVPRSAAPLPSIGERGGDEDGDDGDDGEGDEAVSAEYAFGSRRGLSMRARTNGVGNVYSPRGGWSRENELETEYIRHTDAGVVRVVELPPMYGELQR